MTEDLFLQRLFARLGPMPADVVIPPGDDCAALRIAPGRLLLAAVDQVVGDRHFYLHSGIPTPPEQAGRKLLARNLSDIAAMGGRPTFALLASALEPSLDATWLERFCQGIIDCGRDYDVPLIGGDLAVTPAGTVASLTILGEVAEDQVCRRRGAQPGDLLFATGRFGHSLATGHHLTFTPRLAEGRWLAAHHFARAMIDVSDGLLLDARRICAASGTGLRLDPTAVPLRTPQTTVEMALTDGEDYELLAAVPAATAASLLQAWPFPTVPLTRIGEFTAAGEPLITGPAGQPLLFTHDGFDHFEKQP